MHCRLQECMQRCHLIPCTNDSKNQRHAICSVLEHVISCCRSKPLAEGPTSLAKPMPTPRKRRPAMSMPMFCASACSSAPMRKTMPPVTMIPRRPRPPRGRLRLERRSTTIPAHARSSLTVWPSLKAVTELVLMWTTTGMSKQSQGAHSSAGRVAL